LYLLGEEKRDGEIVTKTNDIKREINNQKKLSETTYCQYFTDSKNITRDFVGGFPGLG
jgi:hypothetical protein